MEFVGNEAVIARAVLENIKEIAVDGRASSAINKTLADRARSYFGTWENACKEAGVKPLRSNQMKRYAPADVKQDPKRDCRFYQDDMRCEGLNKMYCKFEDCNFYKPMDGGAEK